MTTVVIALTELVGRDDDLARLESLLAQPENRLLTLLGPGGIGKTRLAVALLERAAEAGQAGTFGDLGATRTADEVLHAIGHAVAPHATTHTLRSIAAALSAPRWLVLDNAEQVVGAVAELVVELLRRVPSLRCIVTSRERLRTDGETTYRVSALDERDAVALFLTRAGAAGAQPPLDHDRVRSIVQRVERIPLAIELAAGQTSVLTLEELEARLDEQLPLLTATRRDAPDRHATMRATLEWSWDLLDDEQRGAVARLSVFESSFPLAGAEEVLGPPDALAQVRALCDTSWLLRQTTDGASRFSMLQVVRELAREKLAEHPGRDEARARHASWVIEAVDGSLTTLSAARALGPAAALAPDLKAIAERAEPELAHRAALAFGRLALHRGPVGVALGLLETVLGRGAAGAEASWHHDHVRARLLLRSGRADEARAALRRCLDASPEPALRAEALATRAAIDRQQGALADAEAAYRESLELAEGRDDSAARARALGELGALVYERGDLDEAEALHRRALASHREADNRLFEGIVLSNLGLILRERGRFGEAERCFEEALETHQATANARFVGIAHADLAALELERGAIVRAARHGRDAMRALGEAEDRRQLALTRALVGAVLAVRGDLDRGEAMLDEADSELAVMGDATYATAARAHRGHLHLARALRAIRTGEPTERELRRARACLPSKSDDSTDEARHAARSLSRAIARIEAIDRALLVAHDASWLRGPGHELAEIGGRKTLRAILDTLVARRQAAPGDALSTEDLVAVGWPEERMLARAGANRVRVALSELRKLGLGELLRRDADGYFLDPDVPLVIAPAQ